MASILRKIGLNVYLVMVPGHCLLAFDLGEGDEDPILGLETTMLGEKDLGEAGKEIEVPEALPERPTRIRSRSSPPPSAWDRRPSRRTRMRSRTRTSPPTN